MAFADLIVGKWNRNLFPWFTPGSRLSGCISFVSYIKPQHLEQVPFEALRCISFVSYIKPQHARYLYNYVNVVYLSFPTSNHNMRDEFLAKLRVVYLSFPTSNHNYLNQIVESLDVVYLSFPTSNHNCHQCAAYLCTLYIFRFLHQTTTSAQVAIESRKLYIFRFLHQTTTSLGLAPFLLSCISFVSYIKPQLCQREDARLTVVYLSFPTSNHNQ